MSEEELAVAYRDGYRTALRHVHQEAEEFREAMKRRRYFNNANGVRRFVEHLKAKGLVSDR